jgi:hypothetical protein
MTPSIMGRAERITDRSWGWLGLGGLTAAAAGVLLVSAPVFVVALLVLLFAVTILPVRPIVGFLLAYPIFFFAPLDQLRIANLPVLNSPLNFLVIASAAVGAVHWLARPWAIPKARLLLPVAACAAVIVVNMAFRAPTVGQVRLVSLLLAMWPFVLTVLLVRTPAQAGLVLRIPLACVVGYCLLFLPLLLAVGARPGSEEVQGAARSVTVSLAGGSLSLNYLLAITFATTVPVFVALAWYRGLPFAHRLAAGGCAALVLGTLLLSGYASAPLGALAGAAAVPLVASMSDPSQRSPRLLYSLAIGSVLLAALLAALLMWTAQGQLLVLRVLNPQQDFSGALRLLAMRDGLLAFLANPVLGWGPANVVRVRAGYMLAGHTTYIKMAYEYGLFFIIPFLWLLFEMARSSLALLGRVRQPIERALLIGFAGSMMVVLALGFVTEVFDGIIPLSVLWLFIGLATVWRQWLDSGQTTVLIK